MSTLKDSSTPTNATPKSLPAPRKPWKRIDQFKRKGSKAAEAAKAATKAHAKPKRTTVAHLVDDLRAELARSQERRAALASGVRSLSATLLDQSREQNAETRVLEFARLDAEAEAAAQQARAEVYRKCVEKFADAHHSTTHKGTVDYVEEVLRSTLPKDLSTAVSRIIDSLKSQALAKKAA